MSATKLGISIGGVGCEISCNDADFLETLGERYRWFESPKQADQHVLVTIVPIEELLASERAAGRAISPRISRLESRGDYVMSCSDNPFFARVDLASGKTVVKMWKSPYCFDGFLRVLLGLVLSTEGGLLLHAAAVIDSARGRVFFGPSGSGKTTVARASGPRTLLTDELAIIRPHSGAYWVYGTPFWGEFTPGKSNARAELAGMYALKKAGHNQLVPMKKGPAVAALYRCVLFFGDDPGLLASILNTCVGLAEAVPVYGLHFRRDISFWELLAERSGEVINA